MGGERERESKERERESANEQLAEIILVPGSY